MVGRSTPYFSPNWMKEWSKQLCPISCIGGLAVCWTVHVVTHNFFVLLLLQVYDFPWPQKGVPEMEKLVDLCRSMDAWLRADRQNVIVVHCHVS